MHRFRFQRPAPGLERFVRYYAQREVRLRENAVVHPVHARAAPLLEFIFGDRFKIVSAQNAIEKLSPRAVVVGSQTRPNGRLEICGNVDCFIILFQPDGLHRLFSLPMRELTDRNYEAHAVLGAPISRLEQRLGNSGAFEERASIADEFLLRLSLNRRGLPGISAAANRMVWGGHSARVEALAEKTGLGLRQFERRFADQVGMSPKLFSRVARFEAALDAKARSCTKSWAEVAQDCGYFDQMHMIREFEEFTGYSPTRALVQMQSLFREQIDAIHSSGGSAAFCDGARIIV
jgi:AraC-like DNA-binding protein